MGSSPGGIGAPAHSPPTTCTLVAGLEALAGPRWPEVGSRSQPDLTRCSAPLPGTGYLRRPGRTKARTTFWGTWFSDYR